MIDKSVSLMTNSKGYPICVECGTDMQPEWFEEQEYKTVQGCLCPTGRKRMNISHFTCPNCLKKEACDDSFAKPWAQIGDNNGI